jgi:hypothetical protein
MTMSKWTFIPSSEELKRAKEKAEQQTSSKKGCTQLQDDSLFSSKRASGICKNQVHRLS